MNIQPVRSLRNHQIKAVDKFIPKNCAALWHAVGTRKTGTTINLLREWSLDREFLKTVIIGPVCVLPVWENEFKKDAPPEIAELVESVYYKTKKSKLTLLQRAQRIWKTKSRVLILNINSLQSDMVIDALLAFKPECIIIDESHELKSPRMTTRNPGKKTKSRLAQLLRVSDLTARRVILTGTPLLNGYLDLWSQFRILDKGEALGLNFFVFRERFFMDKNANWRGRPQYFPLYVPRPGIQAEIEGLIAAKIDRVTKAECLDLPPLEYETHYIELDGDQAECYADMENELVAEVKGETCAATNALTKVLRLLQILGGSLATEDNVIRFEKNTRIEALRKLLTELTPEHKCLVWANFKSDYRAIRELLAELTIPYVEYTGESKDNPQAVEQFQNQPEVRVFLANPQSGGCGITLTASDVSIYYSRGYSLKDREQSIARNHRSGSEIHKSVTVIDLVARGTLDEIVLEALLKKQNFAENVLERIKEIG